VADTFAYADIPVGVIGIPLLWEDRKAAPKNNGRQNVGPVTV